MQHAESKKLSPDAEDDQITWHQNEKKKKKSKQQSWDGEPESGSH